MRWIYGGTQDDLFKSLRKGVDHMMLRYGIIAVVTVTDRFLHTVVEAGDIIEAIAFRPLAKVQERVEEYRVHKTYGAYEQVYTDPDVDIVYIVVSNVNHGKEIKAAFHHGKHVVCEKPTALSCEGARGLSAFAKQKQPFLMEAQESLFLPVTQDTRDILQRQTLGEPRQVVMGAGSFNPAAV